MSSDHDVDAVVERIAEIHRRSSPRYGCMDAARAVTSGMLLALKPGDRLPGGLRVVPEEASPSMQMEAVTWNRSHAVVPLSVGAEMDVAAKLYRAMIAASGD